MIVKSTSWSMGTSTGKELHAETAEGLLIRTLPRNVNDIEKLVAFSTALMSYIHYLHVRTSMAAMRSA